MNIELNLVGALVRGCVGAFFSTNQQLKIFVPSCLCGQTLLSAHSRRLTAKKRQKSLCSLWLIPGGGDGF